MRPHIAVLLLAACKPDAPRASRPHDAVAIPEPAPRNDAAPAPAEDLPAPSEKLGAVPDDVANVQLVRVASDLARPVLVTYAPGDSRDRLFVVEQHVARIRVIEDGAVAKQPFLDLKGKVSTGNEQGLLGLAFKDPSLFYVYYTDDDGHSHVVEYQADGDRADPKSAREIFFLEQPYSNHNGGHLAFGPDGKLWLGLGDGGAAGDPHRAGQDKDNLLAKMLRFDVSAADPKPEIVMMGVRNPWRYDFDPATGDLYIGDVGQDLWENVYALGAGAIDGANLGWNVAEGRHCYDAKKCDMTAFTPPVIDYPHGDGCSVTGGVIYRGKALPALDGVYFYGDFCMGWIRSFRWRADGVRQHWDWRPVLDPDAQVTQLSSFGRDAAGEIYVISLDGTIWKVAPK